MKTVYTPTDWVRVAKKTDVITNYKGIDITVSVSINKNTREIVEIYELWDSETGESLSECAGSFGTLKEAVEWILIGEKEV